MPFIIVKETYNFNFIFEINPCELGDHADWNCQIVDFDGLEAAKILAIALRSRFVG